MEKHKLKDFIDATKEEAGNVAVEEVLPAVVKEAGGFIVSEGVGMLASEIVGAVVPVANNIRLSYKQNRLERNVVEALQIVQRNQDELENKIVKLQQSNLEYQRQITEALLDNIVEEPQDKNEEINDNNLKEIVKYLQNLEKESKKSKPGSVKIPKLKKVSGSDSYKITQLGRQYLTLIEA